jgi:hypothetical protein
MLWIMCGVSRVMNSPPPPATGATLADGGDQAHQLATKINQTRLDSLRRWMGEPMTRHHDNARRKHTTLNFPLVISFSPEKSMT